MFSFKSRIFKLNSKYSFISNVLHIVLPTIAKTSELDISFKWVNLDLKITLL